jgi:hypothetical protein
MTRANRTPADPAAETTELQQRADRLERELQTIRQSIETLRQEPAASTSGPDQPDARAENADDPIRQLRQEPMMAHLLDALEQGKDIGHYGRLVFSMVAHHFLPEEEMIAWLTRDCDFTEEAAVAMLRQVEGRDYNPPRRERILAWQSEQEFPIIPTPDDPDCGNVYRNLKFPQHVYEGIEEYQEKKAESAA